MSDRKIGPTIIVAAVPELEPLAVRVSVAAQLTGLDEVRIRELVVSGEIEGFKVGQTELVYYASLKALIAKAISLMTGRREAGDANDNVIWLAPPSPDGAGK